MLQCLYVDELGIITDVDVQLTIDHWWVGDLEVRLISPSGQEVRLAAYPSIPFGGYSYAQFDDESITKLEGSWEFTYSDRYRPLDKLSAFDGTNMLGAWTLKVKDDWADAEGTLDEWSLTVTTEAAPRPVNAVFFDAFPADRLDPQKWATASRAGASQVGLDEPSDSYALRLNGGTNGSSSATSRVIDLSTSESAALIYWYQRGGSGDSPEADDDLIVEVWDGSDWFEVDRRLGEGKSMEAFVKVAMPLPNGALHEEFQIRMRSIGEGSTEVPLDDWFVDDIQILAVAAGP